MATFKQVNSTIERTKNSLRKKPICENFGQKELRKIQGKYNYSELIYGTEEERNIARIIDNFDEWCMNYTGNN